MDAALSLTRETCSHGVRPCVARLAATMSFDEVRETTGASIAKRQVEQLAIRAAQDFDAFYELRAAARDRGDDLLIISTDGKGDRASRVSRGRRHGRGRGRSHGVGVVEIRVDRRDEDAPLDAENFDPHQRDLRPGIDDDALVQDEVDYFR